MANAPGEATDRLVKVVLVGPPGGGKAAIVKEMAEKYAYSSLRAGEVGGGKVFRTEFFWPPSLPDGGRLRVRLFGISGRPIYQAVEELVMAAADGLVFVANLDRHEADPARAALQSMAQNAQRNELNLISLPAAIQYNQSLRPSMSADEMDEWLGITPGLVPRFLNKLEGDGEMRAAVEWVIAQIADPPDDRSVPPEQQPAAEQPVVVLPA